MQRFELDYHKVARIFVRYACEEELTEQDIDLINSNQSFSAVEPQFLSQYVEVVRERVCARVSALGKDPTPLSAEKLVTELAKIRSDCIFTPTLQRVCMLTAGGRSYLETVFVTIVREFLGSDKLISIAATAEDATAVLREMMMLGLSDECNAVLAVLLPKYIKQHVVSHWKGQDMFTEISEWVATELAASVQQILKKGEDELPLNLMLDIAMRELGYLRISELYKLVECENSAGLNDLARALSRCRDLRSEVVRAFSVQCQRKLLNSASDTVDIILMYLKTIKAFSLVDPQGILLERVSEPIRAELKDRPDTSARLAEGIFGEFNSPLAFLGQELQEKANPHSARSLHGASADPNREFRDWQPDPVDTPTYFVRKQTQDPVSTLIGLYDNKEVFVQQFMKLFSAELLSTSFDNPDAIAKLEQLHAILVQQFGESNMMKTGVMLHDVRTSHKIADAIHESSPELRSISALILSRLYWPSLSRAPQPALPERFQVLIDAYVKHFRELPEYADLDLHWLSHQGRVSITLSMTGRELDMVVRPHEAILISAFDDGPLSLSQLAERTHLEEPLLLEAVQFWVGQLVLAPDGESYKVLETMEEVEEQQRQGESHVVTSSEVLSGQPRKPEKDPFEEMHKYWGYIMGMLTNLGALPVEKIHSFLVMFVPSEDPYVKTKQELESYLLAMTDEGKLKSEDSKFSLPK